MFKQQGTGDEDEDDPLADQGLEDPTNDNYTIEELKNLSLEKFFKKNSREGVVGL